MSASFTSHEVYTESFDDFVANFAPEWQQIFSFLGRSQKRHIPLQDCAHGRKRLFELKNNVLCVTEKEKKELLA